jgi:hypothetical protein
MTHLSQKTTIYLEPSVKKFLQHKAVAEGRSLSNIINDEFIDMLQDIQDIGEIQKRRREEVVSLKAALHEVGLSYDELRNSIH